jgi:hypothetical protein
MQIFRGAKFLCVTYKIIRIYTLEQKACGDYSRHSPAQSFLQSSLYSLSSHHNFGSINILGSFLLPSCLAETKLTHPNQWQRRHVSLIEDVMAYFRVAQVG